MSKQGVHCYAISLEMQAITEQGKGGFYSGNHTKKAQRIHVHIVDKLGDKNTRTGMRRCVCGGWTFTTTWGGAKAACRHCGKVYPMREFLDLPERPLTSAEQEDREVFSMLLSGGDLREDPVREVLVLKDRMGLPAGEFPKEYASHLEHTYRDARVIADRRRPVDAETALRMAAQDMELALLGA